MGSRASTLLRDEELEEIKKETGCELGQGLGTQPGASGWLRDDPGQMSPKSGAGVPGGCGDPGQPPALSFGLGSWRTCSSSHGSPVGVLALGGGFFASKAGVALTRGTQTPLLSPLPAKGSPRTPRSSLSPASHSGTRGRPCRKYNPLS